MTSASVGGPMGIYDYDRRAARHQPFAAAAASASASVRGSEPSPSPFQAAVIGPSSTVTETELKFVSGGVSRPTTTSGAFVRVASSTQVRGAAAAEDDVDAPVDREDPPSPDSFGHDEASARPNDGKALRRLAQNREAARKSRLRKKAYIQTLESSRVKLARMEQELALLRRQGRQVTGAAFLGGGDSASAAGVGLTTPGAGPPPLDPSVAAWELDHARWVEEQVRHADSLRSALQQQSCPDDVALRVLVDAGLAHYGALFRARSAAARRDAFLVLAGAWRAPAERFFLWIGGFRPSEVIETLAPRLELECDMSEDQVAKVRALRQTARQLEDALAQGFDKLRQQTLADALMADAFGGYGGGGGGGTGGFAAAVGTLAGLASFVDQADHLREQTLRNMHKILAPRQAARGLLALADYCQRLRALSTLWAARPREPA